MVRVRSQDKRTPVAIIGFDTSALLNYYASRLPQTVPARSSVSQAPRQTPPWDLSVRKLPQERAEASARGSDPYFDPKDRSLFAKADRGTSAQSQLAALLKTTLARDTLSARGNPLLAADNNKLFALYNAFNRLDTIAKMASRDETLSGVRPGLDRDYQEGLDQVLEFLKTAEFTNLAVLTGKKAASVTSLGSIAYAKLNYTGGALVKSAAVFNPLPGVSSADSFTISITKAGVTTNVVIDLADVQGTLTLDNINAHVNDELEAAGFTTRFKRVQTGGDLTEGTATWGIQITEVPSERVELSSSQATPAIYVAGSTGKADNLQGRLIKLTDLDTTPASQFSANIKPDTGTAAAKAIATDDDGNVYVVGNSTGSFGSAINQASEDVFLTKYDSAGNVQWTRLLGSGGSAGAYSLAVDPSNGSVVVAGSVTGDLTPTSIGGGTDSFVAKYDADGKQTWVRQIAPATNDRASAVSIDASGNIYVGGQTGGVIASGQTSAGGTDAYLTKLTSAGTLVYHRQFGTSAEDSTTHTAIASDGNVVVASVENGHAILGKYSSADNTSPALWELDLGDLQGGALGGITISGGKIYLSGATANASLNAGGAASIANTNSGGRDTFVFTASEAGAADFVSYAGTSASEQGGSIAVAGGKIYLSGTTIGAFPGATSNGVHNLFVAQMDANGAFQWAKQYGGVDGTSQGAAIAADATGSSVLDALKLRRGAIATHSSNQIEAQLTARAGDYFTLKIEGRSATRDVKITIAKGETLRSLALKINSALLFDGKASAYPVKGGQVLKLAVNEGVKVELVAGPKDFDALAGLGLSPQTLVGDEKKDDDSSKDSEPAFQTIGLGLDGKLNLLEKKDAAHAHVVMMAAMALIKQAYNKINGLEKPNAAPTGPAPAYLQARLANYQQALAWFSS
jgi:Beta-propeller repeat